MSKRRGLIKMDAKAKTLAETEAYLAKIRKTVRDSRELVESARLRIAETDRLLESQGFTREQVNGFSFTEEQKRAVNAELASRGLSPLDADDDVLEEYGAHGISPGSSYDADSASPASEACANFTAGDSDGSPENRKRKFNVMMQRFRM